MRYAKRFGILFAALFIFLTGLVIDASAQTRTERRIHRPVIVRHYIVRDPFWYSRGMYDPWYDPYFYDPYLRAQRERYYREQDVKEERKNLREDYEKYARDGVITAKEREKLDKQVRKVNKAVSKLNEHRRRY